MTMKKTASIDWHCHFNENTYAKRLEIKQALSNQTGIPIENIDLNVKILKREQTTNEENISQNIVKTIFDGDKLSSHYIEYLKSKFSCDNDKVNRFFIIDNEVSSLIPQELKPTNKEKKYNILWIRSKNILSYKDFYRDYTDAGVHLIYSNPVNTGGKTALTKMPPILLFGDKLKSSGNGLVWAEIFNHYCNESSAFIEGEVRIDADIYFLRRDLIKKKDKIAHTFEIYKYDVNGKDTINGKSATNIGHKDNIGSLKAFMEMVGDYEKDYMFSAHYESNNIDKWLETKPTERYRLFCQYLGLSIIDEKHNAASKLLKKHQSESLVGQHSIDSLKNLQIEINKSLDTNYESLNQYNLSNDLLNNQLIEFSQKRDNLLIQKVQLSEKFSGKTYEYYENELSNINTDISNILKQINDLENIISKYDTPNFSIDAAQLTININRKKISEKYSNPDKESRIIEYKSLITNIVIPDSYQSNINLMDEQHQKLQSDLSALKAAIKHKTTELGDMPNKIVCSNCGSVEDTTSKKNKLKSDIENLSNQTATIDVEIRLLKSKITSKEAEKNQWIKESQLNIQKSIDKLQAEIQQEKENRDNVLFIEIDSLNTQISNHNQYINNKLRLENLESSLNNLKIKEDNVGCDFAEFKSQQGRIQANTLIDKSIEELNNQINEIKKSFELNNQKIMSIQKIIGGLSRDLQDSMDKENQLIADIQREEDLKLYVDVHGKDGINKHIISGILPQLNEDLYNLLDGLVDFNVSIDYDDKSIEFSFERDGIKRRLTTASGFEKTIATLALHHVNINRTNMAIPNIIVLDEILARVGCDYLEKFLYVVSMLKNIFPIVDIITHVFIDEVKELIDKKIEIIKEKNISKFNII